MKPSIFLGRLKESVTTFWDARNPREHTILTSVGLLLLLWVIYALFFGPALQGRTQLGQALPTLRQQSLDLQVLARRAAELKNASAPAVTQVSQESISASLAAAGMKPQSLGVTEDQVRVQLNPVSFSALVDWISQQQKVSRLEVVDATVTALPQTDMVNATLTLKQRGNGEQLD